MPATRRAALLLPLLLAGFLLLPPFGRPYSPGLDPGYAWGVAESFRQGAVPGLDTVFPYGPLGFLLLGPPDPELAPWSLVYLLGVHCAGLAAVALLLLRRGSRAVAWAWAAAALAVHVAFFSSIEHEPAVAVAALLMPALAGATLAPAAAAAAGALAALALLVKISTGAIAGALVLAGAVALAVRGRPGRRPLAALAGGGLAVLAAAVPLLFGSPSAFVSWLSGEAELAAGFASAMSVPGPGHVEAIGACALGLLALAACAAHRRRPAGAGVWLGLLPAAWLAWRHGFVRADGHLFQFAYLLLAWLLLAGLALPPGAARRIWTGVLAASLAVALATTTQVERPGGLVPRDVVTGRSGLGNLWSYLHARGQIEGLAAQSRERLAPLRVEGAELDRWRTDGTSFDVLPWDLLLLAANGLAWRPNPVLQLYLAATPELDRRVAAHFASPRAPDRVVVHFETIDGRQLLWEAPETWRTLLARYAPAATQPFTGRRVLERRARPAAWSERALDEIELAPDQWVSLPRVEPGERLLLALDLEPTPLGRLRGALFRTEPLALALGGEGGRVRHERLVPGVAGGGLIVDLPVRGPEDFDALFAPEAAGCVRRIRLEGPGVESHRTPVRARLTAARLR